MPNRLMGVRANRRRQLAFAAASVLAATSTRAAQAQVNATPRSLGMGGAYVAVARGTEALFQNPANLALRDGPRWSLFLPQVTVGATVVGYEAGDVSDLFRGSELTQSRRDELLARLPAGGGTEGQLDVRLPIVALQVGRFAVGVSAAGVGDHTVGRDLVDLALNGYQQGRTNYSVGNTGGRSAAFFDAAAAYGFGFGPLKLGATGHYYRGQALSRTRMSEPRYNSGASAIEVDYVGVRAEGGEGYGVDLGGALKLLPSLTVSAAVTNAFSYMAWSDDLRYRTLVIDSAGFDDVASLRDGYETSDRPYDATSAPLSVVRVADGFYEEAYFPATLRAGAAWEPTRRTRFGASYEERLTSGFLAGRWDRTAAVGVEQSLPLLALRAGFATDLGDGSMLAAGLSLGPIDVGLAKLTNATADSATRDGWIGTAGLGFRGKAPRRK